MQLTNNQTLPSWMLCFLTVPRITSYLEKIFKFQILPWGRVQHDPLCVLLWQCEKKKRYLDTHTHTQAEFPSLSCWFTVRLKRLSSAHFNFRLPYRQRPPLVTLVSLLWPRGTLHPHPQPHPQPQQVSRGATIVEQVFITFDGFRHKYVRAKLLKELRFILVKDWRHCS